jgi:hypothetical protein
VKKYGIAGQATDDNITRRMRIARWITNDIDAHPEYVIRIAFHGNNVYANTPQCCVIRTLPILFWC